MEEVLTLLEEYGLEMDFPKSINEESLLKRLEAINRSGFFDDTSKGFIMMTGWMHLNIRDFEKLRMKAEIPEKFKKIGRIMEENVIVEISFGLIRSFFWDINANPFEEEFIQQVLRSSPEDLGVSKEALELRGLFGEQNAIKKEVERISRLTTELRDDPQYELCLRSFTSEILSLLKRKKHDSDWYREYAKEKSKKFLIPQQAG